MSRGLKAEIRFPTEKDLLKFPDCILWNIRMAPNPEQNSMNHGESHHYRHTHRHGVGQETALLTPLTRTRPCSNSRAETKPSVSTDAALMCWRNKQTDKSSSCTLHVEKHRRDENVNVSPSLPSQTLKCSRAWILFTRKADRY